MDVIRGVVGSALLTATAVDIPTIKTAALAALKPPAPFATPDGYGVTIRRVGNERGLLAVELEATRPDGKALAVNGPLYFANPPIFAPTGTMSRVTVGTGRRRRTIQVANFGEDLGAALRAIVGDVVRLHGLGFHPKVPGDPTLTVYPNAHPETTSVDGIAEHFDAGGLSWAALRGGAGTAADDATASGWLVYLESDVDLGWLQMRRTLLLFDTSALTAQATISAATMSVYGSSALSDWAGYNIAPYASAPASNTAIAAGDFDSLGATAWATAILYSAWAVGWNDFGYNATGLAAIAKTGITKSGLRNANFDAANSEPGVDDYVADISGYLAEHATYDPKLVITYTLPVTAVHTAFTG